jgi:DNA polymerase-3 subunit alpha
MAQADGLRKAMGKKIAAMMEEHRTLFMKGGQENGHDPQKTEELFNLMEKFGGYGFNKSHSAAYALIAFQTAFLKAHFPVEFIAALMTSERSNSDAVLKYMDECKAHNIKVLPPDVNQSDAFFNVDNDCIRFGLAAIKGVGEAAIESIVENREKEGEYTSLYNFCERVNLSKANKKVLEALIKCGALDATGDKRAQMMAVLEDALDHGSRIQKEKADAQLDLFADSGVGICLPSNIPRMPDMDEWEGKVLLELEKEALGFYITGHPMDDYADIIGKFASVNTVTLQDVEDEKMIRIGGNLKVQKIHKTKKGDLMAFCNLEDQYSTVELVVFPNLYARTHTFLSQEQVVIVEAEVQKKENTVKLLGEAIVPATQAETLWAAGIVMQVDAQQHKPDVFDQLKPVIERYPGNCVSLFNIHINAGHPDVMVKLSDEYKSDACPGFFQEIETILGPGTIETRCAPVKEKVKKKKRWSQKQVT